ncbi:hypothetical protein ES705_09431 [subsurface metagenome]
MVPGPILIRENGEKMGPGTISFTEQQKKSLYPFSPAQVLQICPQTY